MRKKGPGAVYHKYPEKNQMKLFTKNATFVIIKLYMTNKGELWMEYGSIDEVTRREACERVKQIVKAIKAIKIKYYRNFSKISEKDQETYQKLEANLEKISNSHNLNNLKVALMQDLERYDGKNPEELKEDRKPDPDKFVQACYGAIDAEKEALSRGKITQAFRCQQIYKKYIKELDKKQYNEVINYKREKFAELGQSRDQIEEQIKEWKNTMKGMCKTNHAKLRHATIKLIQEIPNKEAHKEKQQDESITI